jgi:hypothetical protein
MSFGSALLPFIVLAAVLWCLNAFVASAMAGWRTLSRQFPAGARPPAGVVRGGVVRVGPGTGVIGVVNSHQTRRFGVFPSDAGLYLDAGFPSLFRWPALLIPWSDVRLVTKRTLLGKESVELRLGPSVCYLTVTKSVFEQISPFLK